MIYTCYFCCKEITGRFFWAPMPRVGSYAAICAECSKKFGKEAKA